MTQVFILIKSLRWKHSNHDNSKVVGVFLVFCLETPDVVSRYSTNNVFFLLSYRWQPKYTTSSGKASGKEIPIGISYRELLFPYREFTIGTFVWLFSQTKIPIGTLVWLFSQTKFPNGKP